jgi:hypothetical protein
VAVNARELPVPAELPEQVGAIWQDGPDLAYAVVDEAQLGALLALAQRLPARAATAAPQRLEIVPGTSQALSNGANVKLEMARDFDNGFIVGDRMVDLPHEDVLLVRKNGRVVAVRAGATQYWTEVAEAPEIPELPPELRVPAVGTPFRFERTLIAPEDRLVIECDYVYAEAGDE